MAILTDEELRRLKGKLTPEQIDALSDDEVHRLHAIVNQAESGLAGKPTLAQSEAPKATPKEQPATPAVSLPSYPGQVPPLPTEGPKDLKSFLASLGEAATGGASRQETPEQAQQPIPAADAELNNPAALGERVRKAQDALISSSQPMSAYEYTAPMNDKQADLLTKIAGQAAYTAVKGIVASNSQFILDPVTQLKDHPAEFALNALLPALEIGKVGFGLKAFKDLSSVKTAVNAPLVSAIAGGAIGAADSLRSRPDEPLEAIFEGAGAAAVGGLAAEFVGQLKGFNRALAEIDANLARIPGAFHAEVAEAAKGAPGFAEDIQGLAEVRKIAAMSSEEGRAAKVQDFIDRRIQPVDRRKLGIERDQIDSLYKDIRETVGEDHASDVKKHDAIYDEIRRRQEDGEITGPQESVLNRMAYERYVEETQPPPSGEYEPPPFTPLNNESDQALNDLDRRMSEAAQKRGPLPRDPESLLAEAAPEQIAAARDVIETRLDALQAAKDSNRELGANPELQAELRQSQAILEGASTALEKAASSQAEAAKAAEAPKVLPRTKGEIVTTADGITYTYQGNLKNKAGDIVEQYWQADKPMPKTGDKGRVTDSMIRKNGLMHPDEMAAPPESAPLVSEIQETARETGEAPPLPSTEVSGATDTAKASVKLQDALSVTPVGMALLVGAASADKTDPAPRAEGSPLAIRHALWAVGGGILAYGAFRYFKAADWAAIGADLTNVTSTEGGVNWAQRGKQTADFEKFAKDVLAPLFPDTPANGAMQKVVGLNTLAGAGFGGFVGSGYGRDEFSVPGLLGGAATGAMMGSVMGRGLSKMFATDRTFRHLYIDWMTEGAGMSESALAAKRAARIATEGRIREIADVTKQAAKFDTETQSKMQAFMSGNMPIDQVPEKARWSAEKMRFIFDSLTLDMLSSGLVEDDVLRATYESNLGTYVPRLMLRYELDSHPREIVHSWLRSQGKGWGSLSDMSYNKRKDMSIPEDVLKALGEIKDSPSYLLAKRGTQVAADIEAARYHRFILSSPENALPDEVLGKGLKAKRAYERMRKADYLANKARELTDKQNVGEIPETNYSPELAREAQAKAEARIGKGTIASGHEYLAPDSVHPKFFNKSDGLEGAYWQGRTYWKMPDNPKYGLLKGKYVEQAVASDVMGMHDTASGLSNLYTAPLSAFKFFKAVANPGSLIRNGVSNVIFADLEAGIGFGPWNWAKWTRGFNDLRTGNSWYLRARKAGTFGGEFTKAEQLEFLEPHMAKSENMMDFIGRVAPSMGQRAADKLGATFTKIHQTTEAHARQTVFRHAVESLGMDDDAAATFARRTIPDYQDVPRWIKVVRSNPFGAPFISFSYKAIPRSLEAATAFGNPKKMMSFWKYPLAMAGLAEYGAQKFGLLGKDEKTDVFGTVKRIVARGLSGGTYSPDSYDTYRKYLPGHVGQMQITIPWRDQYDRPQYLDGTFFLPWGDAGEMGKGDIGQKSGVPFLPRQIEPSNPWFQLGVAATTGKDNFTGRDIIPPGAVGGEQIAAMGQFLMRSWGPSLAPGAGYGAESLSRSFSGNLQADPNVKTKMGAIASDILGARSRPVDPRSSFRFRAYDLRDKLNKNASEIRRYAKGIDWNSVGGDINENLVKRLMANNPSKDLVRAINRRKAIIEKFQKDYPAAELPPSPQALIDAIQKHANR